MVTLAGVLGCSPPADDTNDTATGTAGVADGSSTGEPQDGSGSTTGGATGGGGLGSESSSESSGSGESGSVAECLDTEPAGVRVGAFDCEPCSGTGGFGSTYPHWVVARVELPSLPYRIDAVSVVIDGPSPTDLVYFVDSSTVPDPEAAFNTLHVEHAGSVALPLMVSATLDAPLTVGESEHLFVGLHIDAETALRHCDAQPGGDPLLWALDDPPTMPWVPWGGVHPQIQAYGGPG